MTNYGRYFERYVSRVHLAYCCNPRGLKSVKDYSTKGVTRESRANETSRFYQLSEGTPHSSQNAITTVSANKKQLIDVICRNVVSDVTCHVQDASKDKCT